MDDPLDGIDWTDLCHLGAELLAMEPDPRHRDLHGQGLTAMQLHTIVDIPIPGGTL